MFILKNRTTSSKGIIVLSHKELLFIDFSLPCLKEALKRLEKLYVIGAHWGHYHPNVRRYDHVSFHLAGPGTITLEEGNNSRHIPLCSRNFVPEVFRKKEIQKFWDIITVARPLKLKNLDQMFFVIRKLLDRGRLVKALFVCACPPDLKSTGFYSEIRKDYEKIFTEREREQITLMLLSHEGYPFQLPQETLAHFYNSSRIFALFSDQEGESRVISEALLCGLPVVVKSSLRGGGRDYLNSGNSRMFSNLEEAADAFIEILDHPERFVFNISDLENEMSESYTRKKLVFQMKKIFEDLGLEFSGDLNLTHLDRALPGHLLTLEERFRTKEVNDFRNEKAALNFINILTGKTHSKLDEMKVTVQIHVKKIEIFATRVSNKCLKVFEFLFRK